MSCLGMIKYKIIQKRSKWVEKKEHLKDYAAWRVEPRTSEKNFGPHKLLGQG